MSAISRRTALGLAAAGVAAVAAGGTAIGSGSCAGRPATRTSGPTDAALDYVDRDGWMLTPAEGEKLSPAGPTGS
jgi:hypothetical protein